jgi:hypothetical protein
MKCLHAAWHFFVLFSGRIHPLARSGQGAASLVVLFPDNDANDSQEEKKSHAIFAPLRCLVKKLVCEVVLLQSSVVERAIGNKWIDSFDFARLHRVAETLA